MKLPTAPALSTSFKNAVGSNVPKEFAVAARANPDNIPQMAENVQEMQVLQLEALARQYVIIIDRSGSMASRDGRGSRSLLET
jgi:hypothetical protein